MSNNDNLLTIDDQTLSNIMNRKMRSASKNFKNPPQPKFCIKESTKEGLELYINVLSYSRIANQNSEFDPVPLYGGMRVHSYNSVKNPALIPQSAPQLIFAVMASPEVLKKTGRNHPDTPERMNLVELMCEFVEAMNPGLVLSKKPEILKDKDLAGELKDVWTAVQTFRDKEKAGIISDIVVYTEFGPESAPMQQIAAAAKSFPDPIPQVSLENGFSNNLESIDGECQKDMESVEKTTKYTGEDATDKVIDNNTTEVQSIEIEKLKISDTTAPPKNNESDNESSEKIVKVQNQKNKESQHNFFPKFLSSSRDKEKEVKDKSTKSDDSEHKNKTKKSLNFFRRNKSASSPTNNITNQQQKSDNSEN